jgi:hypothetical protein
MIGRSQHSSYTRSFIIIVLLSATACSDEASPPVADDDRPIKQENDEVFYCGGETTVGVARRYFQQLNEAIEQDLPSGEFDRFIGNRFSTVRDGRFLVFIRDEVAPATPTRISSEDWSEIARRGVDRLWGNYRGCMFNHGKVWFQGDGNTFELSAINHDIEWEE